MRRPIDTQRPGHSRELLWQIIRARKEFMVGDLLIKCDLDVSTVSLYLRSLVKAGYLEISGQRMTAGGMAHVYKLIKDAIEPPRVRKDGSEVTQGRGREQMWQTMRRSKKFTLRDLWALSSTSEHPVALEEAQTYLRYLEWAGYVRNLDGEPRQKALYMLVRNTGPKPPMIQRIRQVYDPNTKQVVWPVKADGREEKGDGR